MGERRELLGMVMPRPHSKGGHLDNLTVAPQARGRGVGKALVEHLRANPPLRGRR
jgi:ribosomal protein S18 acetylase RimI-like enzyme